MKILLLAPILLIAIQGVSSGSQPELKTAAHYQMQYYLSLPEGWNAKQKWPVMVTIEGAGCGWRNNAEQFAAVRGKLPFIIVTPVVITNMGGQTPRQSPYSFDVWNRLKNDPEELFRFDREGVLAVVREVAATYSGQEKFFLTGFSSGGHLAWSLILNNPEKLVGASLACAAFSNRGVAHVSNAPERVKLPIKGFQGSNDLIEFRKRQWGDAKALAEEHGYRNFEYEMVPGEGHTPMTMKTVAWFSYIGNRSRKS